MLISTSKFFKDNKIAQASRGSEDFDCHHKIYLIPTKALKSFHDSLPPPLPPSLVVHLLSIFKKKISMLRSQNPLPPSPPLRKINNGQSLRSFLRNRTWTEIFVWSVNKRSEAGDTPGDFIWSPWSAYKLLTSGTSKSPHRAHQAIVADRRDRRLKSQGVSLPSNSAV